MEEKKKEISGWRIFFGIILILIAIGLFVSVLTGENNDSSASNPLNNANSYSNEKIVILNHQLSENDYGNLIVAGSAKNNFGRNLDYAEIDVKFYDSDGAVIGNSLDNINNFGDGETWKFEVYYMGLDTYKVKDYSIEVGSVW